MRLFSNLVLSSLVIEVFDVSRSSSFKNDSKGERESRSSLACRRSLSVSLSPRDDWAEDPFDFSLGLLALVDAVFCKDAAILLDLVWDGLPLGLAGFATEPTSSTNSSSSNLSPISTSGDCPKWEEPEHPCSSIDGHMGQFQSPSGVLQRGGSRQS